jgi:hypothetical protein
MFIFKSTETVFKELINSERYKESNYIIQLLNNKNYIIKRKNVSEHYVDLIHPWYTWSKNDRWFDCCVGTQKQVIKTFNHLVPNTFITLTKDF